MTTFEKFLKNIENKGGIAMLIGGAVIDSIMNRPIKDWDIEIYNMQLNDIVAILTEMELSANLVGASFGVIKTKMDGIDFDLSIPRTENKIGIGHKEFEVSLNSDLTPSEAGRRRDLTINSMYRNLHTNKLVDPFNGLNDLRRGIIRATDATTFVEDPLRVLRIMQLLPRKGKVVDNNTVELCKSMVSEFDSLPKERVFEEFNKLLLKASKPSMGLTFLRDSGWITHFPELNNLIGCEQNLDWHPEGDVWNHTCIVIDNAAQLKDNIDSDLKLAFMYGALLHDVGKPSTTLADLTSHGHDEAGVEIATSFMNRLTNDKTLIDNVQMLVKLHMRVGQLTAGNARVSSWKRLHNLFRLDVLGWLSKCDSAGRTGRNLTDGHMPSELAFKYFSEFGKTIIKPLITGKDLIALGWTSGKELGDKLKELYEIQIECDLNRIELLNKI